MQISLRIRFSLTLIIVNRHNTCCWPFEFHLTVFVAHFFFHTGLFSTLPYSGNWTTGPFNRHTVNGTIQVRHVPVSLILDFPWTVFYVAVILLILVFPFLFYPSLSFSQVMIRVLMSCQASWIAPWVCRHLFLADVRAALTKI